MGGHGPGVGPRLRRTPQGRRRARAGRGPGGSHGLTEQVQQAVAGSTRHAAGCIRFSPRTDGGGGGPSERADPLPRAGDTRARYRRILRFAAWHLAVTWWFELLLPRVGLGRIAERTRASGCGASLNASTCSRWSWAA